MPFRPLIFGPSREERPMSRTAADVLIETLIDWGVDVVFGLPGDGINGIMESLRTHAEKIRFVQVRHEEAAAFMATGYAKFTGKLGVCLGTSGPGGIHLLNGLYDAKLDGQPVLAIAGAAFHDLIDTMTQQDVPLDRLYQDVAVFNTRVMGPAHVENVTHLACRTALAYRGVSAITFPVDIQSMSVKADERSDRNLSHHANEYFRRSAGLPGAAELDRAAEVLAKGERVCILAGRGALGCSDELEQLAEKLGAPIVKALLGKAAVPDDSPYTTGGIGLLGTAPSQDAMERCDTLLMVGTSFPYIEFYPKIGHARCVQVEVDPQRIGLRFPVDVALVGDARATLQALLPRVERHEDRRFLEAAQTDMETWRKTLEERGTREDVPMKPQVAARELGLRLPDNAIVCCDSGTIATWFARYIPAKRGMMMSLSGTLASMANGMPYAIAAAIAHPDRPVFAFVGDGGFSMLMAELATAVKYGLNLKIVIIKNDTLGQIKWEQMVFLGNPEFGCDLQTIDFAAIARAMGAAGFYCEDPKQIGAIYDAALATPGPVVVEAKVDPFEPPWPPKITAKQARMFAQSLLRGEPNRGQIALTAASDKVRELL
jgi:pyruvate dehydrogenase (quinone)/pyruvate oxidase